MLACNKPCQVAPIVLCASKNSWSRPGFTRKRTALKAVTIFSHSTLTFPRTNRVYVFARVESARIRCLPCCDHGPIRLCLLSRDHLCQLMAQFRAILMAMHRDSVLYRRFQKLLFGIGWNRDRAVHLTWIISAIHKHSTHVGLPYCEYTIRLELIPLTIMPACLKLQLLRAIGHDRCPTLQMIAIAIQDGRVLAPLRHAEGIK